jgi:integrase/recombinase XerD
MTEKTLLGPWIRRFLLEHAVEERNFSRNTQLSYRDTLTLLLPFISTARKMSVDRLTVEDLSAPRIYQFLAHLEKDRHCSGATRNQRLGTIHSLAKFIGRPQSPTRHLVCRCTRYSIQENRKTSDDISG